MRRAILLLFIVFLPAPSLAAPFSFGELNFRDSYSEISPGLRECETRRAATEIMLCSLARDDFADVPIVESGLIIVGGKLKSLVLVVSRSDWPKAEKALSAKFGPIAGTPMKGGGHSYLWTFDDGALLAFDVPSENTVQLHAGPVAVDRPVVDF